jgi:hypothetical protein
VDNRHAQGLLERLKGRAFSHDALIEFARDCRQILAAHGYRLSEEYVMALFVVSRRADDAASRIEMAEGDPTRHQEIEDNIRPRLFEVLEALAAGCSTLEALKKLIMVRLSVNPDGTFH